MNNPNKICSTCGKEKFIEEFGIMKTNPDGYRNTCKDCRKNFYYSNHEKMLREKKNIIYKTRKCIKNHRKNIMNKTKKKLNSNQMNITIKTKTIQIFIIK